MADQKENQQRQEKDVEGKKNNANNNANNNNSDKKPDSQPFGDKVKGFFAKRPTWCCNARDGKAVDKK